MLDCPIKHVAGGCDLWVQISEYTYSIFVNNERVKRNGR